MKLKHAFLLLLSVFFTLHVFAQRDEEEREDKDGRMKDFIEKRQDFLEANAGTKNLTTVNYREWQRFNTTSKTAGYTTLNGNWGQITINQQSPWGMGRVNCFAMQPGTPSTIWVATPSGGLWKTTNSGTNWNNYTDALPVPGVAGVCIDPNLTSTLYILTGTASIVECQSIGVFKSTDGGVNWFATGLDTARQPQGGGYGWSANELLMDPNNSSILFACMNNGLFRTQDAGATWTNVFPGNNVKDMVFHPTNSNIIYLTTGGGQIFSSNNNGLTFSGIQGVPAVPGYPNTQATTLAVSPAAPDSLFLCLTVSKPGYENVIALGRAKYNATTNALTFGASKLSMYDTGTAVHNLSDMTCALRYWRDARLAVSPATTAQMYVGGLDTWSTNDYGKSWIFKRVNNAPHTDCSQMEYVGTDIYTCDDGGFYKQTASPTNSSAPWSILTGKMPIQQIWRLGISQASTSDFFLALQDNGTHIRTASGYKHMEGGDGILAKIDPNNPSLFYGKSSDNSKIIFKYRNFDTIQLDPTHNNAQEKGFNFLPFEIDQNNGKNLFTAFKSLYTSTDTGNTWTTHNFGGAIETKLMAVCKSNTNVIWLMEDGVNYTIRKTDNGGINFGLVTVPDSIPKSTINDIVICPFDENRVYLVMDGYTAGKKVYVTTNGGLTWRNLSYNLPNVPIYSIAYEDVGDSSIYIGTEIGVYYFNTLINKWIPFNNGLPLCRVQELFINYTSKKLIAGTYGRGIFMTDLYSGSCASTMTLTGSVNQNNTYSAGTQLNSTQTVYGGANSTVRYYSGGAVTMQPGFVAQSGSGFVAAVAGCGGEVDPILDKKAQKKAILKPSLSKKRKKLLKK